MDSSDIETRKTRARAWFEALRDDICTALEAVEDALPATAPSGAVAGRASSTASSAVQMSSRSASNQARARVLRVSMSLESIASAYVMPGGWRAKPPVWR